MTVRLTALMYASMVFAGYVIEGLFQLLQLIPNERNAKVLEASVSWNYTSVLNIIFLIITALLVIRFFKTGGKDMLKMMSEKPNKQMASTHHH